MVFDVPLPAYRQQGMIINTKREAQSTGIENIKFVRVVDDADNDN